MNRRTCARAQNNKLGGHPWQRRCYVRGTLSKATVGLSRDTLQVLGYLKSHCLIDTGATQAAHAHTSWILASELKNCLNKDVNTLNTLDKRGAWDWREAERMESARKLLLYSSPVTVQGCPLAGQSYWKPSGKRSGQCGVSGSQFSYRTDDGKERMELGENTLTRF